MKQSILKVLSTEYKNNVPALEGLVASHPHVFQHLIHGRHHHHSAKHVRLGPKS